MVHGATATFSYRRCYMWPPLLLHKLLQSSSSASDDGSFFFCKTNGFFLGQEVLCRVDSRERVLRSEASHDLIVRAVAW
jgi:hypothetical protein